VAGLVPGACEGRGRGNRFLNDLCDADALVHITDSSASADANGNLIVTDPHAPPADSSSAKRQPRVGGGGGTVEGSKLAQADGTSSMREDVTWVHLELHRWVYDNIASAWDKVLRKPSHLFNLFTGYQCPPSLAEAALRTCAPPLPPLEHVCAWEADDVAALVDSFLALRFATVVCANKADLPASAQHIRSLQAELRTLAPALAESVVPASALCEVALQQLERQGTALREPSQDGSPPGSAHSIRVRLLRLPGAADDAADTGVHNGATTGAADTGTADIRVDTGADSGVDSGHLSKADAAALKLARRCGYELVADDVPAAAALAQLPLILKAGLCVAGGVQATLQRAFWLRPPIVVIIRITKTNAKAKHRYNNITDKDNNSTHSTGTTYNKKVFPVCDLATAKSYPLSEAALRDGEPGSDSAHVRDVLLLRPGSTVADLFGILLHAPYKLLGGEFVRAEGRPLGDPRAVRQLRKEEALHQGFVVRFYSTRKGQRVK